MQCIFMQSSKCSYPCLCNPVELHYATVYFDQQMFVDLVNSSIVFEIPDSH